MKLSLPNKFMAESFQHAAFPGVCESIMLDSLAQCLAPTALGHGRVHQVFSQTQISLLAFYNQGPPLIV